MFQFDDRRIGWRQFGSAQPLNPDGTNRYEGLQYWVLDVDRKRGVVDMLFRMAPDAACTPHRHLGHTATFVIAGEHRNLAPAGDDWVVKDVRLPGTLAVSEGDHFHREAAGPEGALVHLRMTAVDGVIWTSPGRDGAPGGATTVDDFQAAFDHQKDPGQALPRPESGL